MIDSNEHMIVSNLMKLKQLSVRDIMTPRPVIFSVSKNMTVQDFFNAHSTTAFSRIPVYDKKSDHIEGYILKTDLLIAQAKDEFERLLSEFVRELPVLPHHMNASEAYENLLTGKSHMAITVDEYGTIQGLVTQEDIVETLIGLEITDELDKVEDMQVFAHKRWRERMEAIGINPDMLNNKD